MAGSDRVDGGRVATASGTGWPNGYFDAGASTGAGAGGGGEEISGGDSGTRTVGGGGVSGASTVRWPASFARNSSAT